MSQFSLSSVQIEEIKKKLEIKHYENTIFNKVELFISRICHDDKNRLHLLNEETQWLEIFNKFKNKLNNNGFNFNQIQGGTRTVTGKRTIEGVSIQELIQEKKDKINEHLINILKKTTLFDKTDMKKDVNINKQEYLDTLQQQKDITEQDKQYFLRNSSTLQIKIDEKSDKYIYQLVEIYFSRYIYNRTLSSWVDRYVKENNFIFLGHFLGYIFHLTKNDLDAWNLNLKALNINVSLDFKDKLNSFNFIRKNRDENINFSSVVNYLVIMLCLYNIYYNTRIGVQYRNEKSKVNNDDVIIQGFIPTFNYETTNQDFLAKISYNTRFDDKTSSCTSKKVEINNGHVELKDYYLKQKIYLGNEYNKVYNNLIRKDSFDISTFKEKFNDVKPTLTTYNLQEKNIANNNFEKLIDYFINKMYVGQKKNDIKSSIKSSIKESAVNLYQEVNRNLLTQFVKNTENTEKIEIKLDSDFENQDNILGNFFMNNNNIVKNSDNGNYTIPCYKLNNRFYVYTTDRLSSFDGDNLNKCNLICSDKEIGNNNIFIGKLLDSCIIHWTHTFIAIKKNNNIYINIHLDTDKSKYTSQIELMYLLKHVIPKYTFFQINENQKIYIAGDFNLDCADIINTIILKVNDIFYKNKIFKIALNNIITHENGNSLDNCIIIEYRTKQSSSFSSTPIIGSVPEPVKYNPDIFVSKYDNSDELPDHGLVILKDREINSSLNEDCSAIFEDIYINISDEMELSGGSKKNVGDLKKNVSKKNVGDLKKNVSRKNINNSRIKNDMCKK